MILSRQSIRARRGMVYPMMDRAESHGLTYGLGPAGYDVRIAETMTIEPGAFVLASTIERFDIPADVLARVCDKSTWARRGLSAFNTVIEPGWRGYLTLELCNNSCEAIAIVESMPIVQITFELLDQATDRPYTGRYQDQKSGPQAGKLSR